MQFSDQYFFYWSGPFSQWHRSEFTHAGQSFDTAEQAMMYEKAMLFEDRSIAEEIRSEKDPGRQKALGQQVKPFDATVWDQNKVAIVTEINRAKFGQNKGLRRKLFQTAPLQLVEASPMDTIWGIGLDAKQAETTKPEFWPGQNLLGQILTKVRQELAQTFPDEAHACAGNYLENELD